MPHFIDLLDISSADLRSMLTRAAALKKQRAKGEYPKLLADKKLAMIFEKNSTRTRVSFEVGMVELGGHPIFLSTNDMQLGRGESIADTARVLSRYVDAITLRCHDHAHLRELAACGDVPVINALSNLSHPCQIMADILTIEEHRGPITGKTIAWVGDGNNVANSFISAAIKVGFTLRLACPPELTPHENYLNVARVAGADVIVTASPQDAVAGADAVVTDCWVSMGDTDADRRMQLLAPYQVDAALMARAKPDALFLHCLPAHRGEEVTADVIDGPQSVIWDEAENRLHAQKAVLLWCLGMV